MQVTLTWDNDADLDLHVVEPSGEEIWYEHTESATGGFLDVDDVDGEGPENVFWFVGAPSGRYVVRVVHFSGSAPGQLHGPGEPLRLEPDLPRNNDVRGGGRDGHVVRRVLGTVRRRAPPSEPGRGAARCSPAMLVRARMDPLVGVTLRTGCSASRRSQRRRYVTTRRRTSASRPSADAPAWPGVRRPRRRRGHRRGRNRRTGTRCRRHSGSAPSGRCSSPRGSRPPG